MTSSLDSKINNQEVIPEILACGRMRTKILFSVLRFGQPINFLLPLSRKASYLAKVVPSTMQYWKMGAVQNV
ncbi:MAG: hypothetical protein EZS28_022459 [Streblomastix strix]|uniref:Uncharacterized protein n=1 Tax=Streblomastix strix TaxID=222440 RepID=A0A5J4VIB7_9EUKA|nr:MAG: hypothetical protein EZS28_022459 [Streblomastix strix]